jgi:hypothetical protein
MVALTYNPSYSGGRGKRITRPYLKNKISNKSAKDMVQVVEYTSRKPWV